MNKKEHAKILFEALTDVDDAFVSEAQREPLRKEQKQREPISFFTGMKYAAAVFACAVIAFIMFNLVQVNDATDPNNNIQITNPITEVETMEEAESITGFALEYESLSEQAMITVYDENMIEVTLMDGEDTVCYIRKSKGSGDISGDYSEYEVTETRTFNGMEISLKGDGDMWSLALWEKEGYTYAIGCQSHPMTFDQLCELIETVK